MQARAQEGAAAIVPAADPAQELQRGETLRQLGALDAAAAAFRRVVAARPDDIEAHEKLRRTLIAAHLSAELPPVLGALSALYHQAGNPDLAMARLQELKSLAPTDARVPALEQALAPPPHTGAQQDRLHLGARLRSLLGVVVILGLAVLLSVDRRRINWRLVAWGLGLQLAFAMLVLWTPPGRALFDWTRIAVNRILSFADAGTSFLFGNLARGLAADRGSGPMQIIDGSTGDPVNLGMVFAFHVLPTIVFFAALMSVLYHFGIIQKVVRGISWVMMRTMGTSGPESLSCAANIFVGQTEAPLVVKPYLATMTASELMAIMVGGFATVAGGVLAAYVRFGIDAGHLLAASVMGAPAALALAKIVVPEVDTTASRSKELKDPERTTSNVIDAAAEGALDGLKLALNVGAMLMAFIALVALVNWVLGFAGLSLQEIFGYVFMPLSWCIGVDTNDLLHFGNLLGTKIALNEFVAYINLGNIRSQLSERTFTLATYALCGFANFSSIGVQIGGIGAMAPQRRSDLAKLGLRAMLTGAMASLLSASVAGILL